VKLLVFILVTLMGAVAVALWVMEDPGYVLIAAGPWTVETTLALAVVALLVVFAMGYYLIRFGIRIFGVPRGVRHWRERQRQRKAQHALMHGLIAIAEGDWQGAERQVLKAVKDSDTPLLNYLAAARAAQEQGAADRRDRYLQLAHQHQPTAEIAVGLTQAELQLRQQQREQALASLRHLQQLAPKHPRVLSALATLYRELGDWEHLLELLPSLRKRRLFSAQELDGMARQAYQALLAASGAEVRQTWSRVAKAFQEDEAVLATYAEQLLSVGKGDLAEPLLRHAIKRRRSERLMRLYGRVEGTDPNGQLVQAESWLVGHEEDAATLLTAGRLALRCKLWGKAREYLEASVNARPTAEGFNELGNLLEQLGEPEAALENYRQGLRLLPGCAEPLPLRVSRAETVAPALPTVAR
jgi:HemY protein